MRKYKTAVQLIEIGLLKTMEVMMKIMKNGLKSKNKC